jgi:hypothetical protein
VEADVAASGSEKIKLISYENIYSAINQLYSLFEL